MTIEYAWRRSRNGIIFATLAGETSESLTDTGLTASTPYYYQRVATNSDTGEVVYSNVVLAPIGPGVIASDVQNLAVSALVELFVLDYTALGGDVVRFQAGTNELRAPVVWQGFEYQPFPVVASGFELSGRGVLPQPTLRVSNTTGLVGALCALYEDLIGATITRKRTMLKYLDAVNFAGGINATADPTQYWPDDIWEINRKSAENGQVIEFQLAAAFDVSGVKLPRRQVVANTCPWVYRSAECSYTGGAVATIRDTPTDDLTLDKCSHRVTGCKFRFGANGELPFGGFPGAGLTR